MARLLRYSVISVLFLFISIPGWAAGGSCPTAQNYLNSSTGALTTLSSLGVTNCYFVAADGADSNSGTSETSPWLHAPGMPNCSGTCASTNPGAGTGFIFRGGDTWHYGAGTPATGGSWTWSWAGTSGSPIYVGVDPNWYSGSMWVRPLLNGDNPITASTALSSCSYDESTMAFANIAVGYVTFDNFEILGGCWHSTQNGNGLCCLVYIGSGTETTHNIIISNNYLHGWSHVRFSCGSGGGSGNCDGAQGISGDSHQDACPGCQLVRNVIDGSDSDSSSFSAVLWNCYDAHQNVIRYNSNGFVCNNMHTFHDNLIEYISESSDGQTHSNGFEFNAESAATNTVYNNVVRHNTAAVVGWLNPSQTDYFFNNIYYDNGGSGAQIVDVDPTGGGTSLYIWNNTFLGGTVGANGSWEGKLQGNIFCDSSAIGSPVSSGSEINWTTAQCYNAGYISSASDSADVIAPTSSNCNGVTPCAAGYAANQTLTCSTYPSLCTAYTAPGSALLGVGYNSGSHAVIYPNYNGGPRLTSGSWDAGAYLYAGAGSGGNSPNPPSGLSAVVN